LHEAIHKAGKIRLFELELELELELEQLYQYNDLITPRYKKNIKTSTTTKS